MVTYASLRYALLTSEGGQGHVDAVRSLCETFEIEARPAEAIQNPLQLVEELEERLVLDPQDDRDIERQEDNVKALRQLAQGLNVDIPELNAIQLVVQQPPPQVPLAATAAPTENLSDFELDQREFGDRRAWAIDKVAKACKRMLWRDVDELLSELGNQQSRMPMI